MRVEYRPIWRKFYVCDNIEQAYDLNNYEPVHNSKYNGLGSNFFEFFLNSSKVNELEVELDLLAEPSFEIRPFDGKVLVMADTIGPLISVEIELPETFDPQPLDLSFGLAQDFEDCMPLFSKLAQMRLSEIDVASAGQNELKYNFWVVDGNELYEIEL